MITKRGFIAGAASVATVAATGSWRSSVSSSGAITAPSAAFDFVVFNDRYSDARAFAQTFVARGTPALPVAGDAGTLWYGTLRQRLGAAPTRLVGLGTYMDFFILETLARDANLTVRFRGQHDCRGGHKVTHVLRADQDASQVARALALSGLEWPLALAAALPSDPGRTPRPSGARGSVTSADVLVRTDVARSPDHPGMLVSWVLT